MDPHPGGSVNARLALLAVAIVVAVAACSDRSVSTLSPPPDRADAVAPAADETDWEVLRP